MSTEFDSRQLVRIADAAERIATALEQAALERMPAPSVTFATGMSPVPPPVARLAGPIDPEPPFSGPSQEFRASRDLPPAPFLPLNTWQCPIHHESKTVPAGVSRASGKPYDAFVACPVRDCNEKPPRAPR